MARFSDQTLGVLQVSAATVLLGTLGVMLWCVLVLRERVHPLEWAAAVIALGGIALFAAPSLHGSVGGKISVLAGVMLCIGAAGCFTGVTVMARKTTVSPKGLTLWQCVIGAVCLSWAPVAEGFPVTLSGWAWLCDLGTKSERLSSQLRSEGARS